MLFHQNTPQTPAESPIGSIQKLLNAPQGLPELLGPTAKCRSQAGISGSPRTLVSQEPLWLPNPLPIEQRGHKAGILLFVRGTPHLLTGAGSGKWVRTSPSSGLQTTPRETGSLESLLVGSLSQAGGWSKEGEFVYALLCEPREVTFPL